MYFVDGITLVFSYLNIRCGELSTAALNHTCIWLHSERAVHFEAAEQIVHCQPPERSFVRAADHAALLYLILISESWNSLLDVVINLVLLPYVQNSYSRLQVSDLINTRTKA